MALIIATRPMRVSIDDMACAARMPAKLTSAPFCAISRTKYDTDLEVFFFFFFFFTHRTSTQHTHKKHRPSLWVGITIRYRRPLR